MELSGWTYSNHMTPLKDRRQETENLKEFGMQFLALKMEGPKPGNADGL